MEQPVIPHMRDVLTERTPAAPVNPQGPALLAVLVFFAITAVGVVLKLITGGDAIFLVSLISGSVLSLTVYFAAKKIFRSYSGVALFQQAAHSYVPLLARVHAWGFEAAARTAEEILQGALPLSETRIREFSSIDESLHFLLSKIVQLGQAKLLIGNERELKKHCDKLAIAFGAPKALENINMDAARVELAALELRLEKLEQISQTALLITAELMELKTNAEPFWNRNLSQNANLARLIQNKHKAQEKITTELNKLGL